MVPVGVADQVVEDGRVDDVQQARPRVVRGRFLHGVAVALVVLPPAARGNQAAFREHPCTAAATAAPGHFECTNKGQQPRLHQEGRAGQKGL